MEIRGDELGVFGGLWKVVCGRRGRKSLKATYRIGRGQERERHDPG